jgi:hypothetical protein
MDASFFLMSTGAFPKQLSGNQNDLQSWEVQARTSFTTQLGLDVLSCFELEKRSKRRG